MSVPVVAGLAGVIVAAAFLPVRAQGLGCKTGLVISDQTENADAVKSLTFGLLAGFPLGRWRFVPSVSIIPKGSQDAVTFFESTPTGYSAVSVSEDPWYVSIQGDLHLTFPLGNANFYFLAAPRVDFLMAVDGGDPSRQFGSEDVPVDVSPYNPVVWGGAIGVGQDLQMSNHTLFLELRYDRDLSPARDISGSWSFGWSGLETESVFNRAFMVQIGVRWGTAKRDDRPRDAGGWPPVNP